MMLRFSTRLAAIGLAASVLYVSPSWAGSAVASSTTTISATPSTITLADSVTAIATVSAAGTICTGTVTFSTVESTPRTLCLATLVPASPNANASCTLTGSQLGTGSHQISASYSGGTSNGYFCTTSTSATPASVTVAAVTPVPTTSEWTLWGMTGLLLIGGGIFASRRFRNSAAV